MEEQKRLLYKISREYYENHLTQQEIGKKLGLSRIKVSRMLKKASEEKIVSVIVTPPPGLLTDLEEAIERKYGIEEARVVHCENPSNMRSLESELAPCAVECLLRRISGNEVIGVSIGKTIMAMVNRMPSVYLPNIRIVQMNGGLGHIVTPEQSAELARQMAMKMSSRLSLLHAPGIARTRAAAEAFKNEPLNAETLNLAASADIAILSIGRLAMDAEVLSKSLLLSQKDIDQFSSLNTSGDIALRFYNQLGQQVETPIDERIIGLTHQQLKKIPCVIAVAGGKHKLEAIHAGLRSGIPDVLITDQLTARQLTRK